MSKWLFFQLKEGSFGGERVMPQSVLRETHKPVSVIPISAKSLKFIKPQCPVTYTADEYALGWRRGFYRGM